MPGQIADRPLPTSRQVLARPRACVQTCCPGPSPPPSQRPTAEQPASPYPYLYPYLHPHAHGRKLKLGRPRCTRWEARVPSWAGDVEGADTGFWGLARPGLGRAVPSCTDGWTRTCAAPPSASAVPCSTPLRSEPAGGTSMSDRPAEMSAGEEGREGRRRCGRLEEKKTTARNDPRTN